jgi:hypothetical protein
MSTQDPYNTFKWIMNINEKYGLQSIFYFFGENTYCTIDGQYDIRDKLIIDLIKQVSIRSHEIGYHGSYYSYLDQKRMQKEFMRLKRICKSLAIEQNKWKARQHYLRYNVAKTTRLQEKIGITYDSSLTFAANAGFRCGCCYEYPLFDFSNRCALIIRERPLIVMERSVLAPKYMNLEFEEAYNFMIMCKRRCQIYKGDFTILWHNNLLVDNLYKELYQSILND